MLAGFLLALREGLEAMLIIGIVLSALRKMGQAPLRAAVWRGVGLAVFLSLVAGWYLGRLGFGLEGKVKEVFEGTAMLLAAALLTWMIFWMHRHSPSFRQNLEAEVSQVLQTARSRQALFGLAFLAVGREGFELALFLLAAQAASDAWQTAAGALAGIGLAVFLGWGFYTSSFRLDLRRFFQLTNLLLILFAAGFVGHGVHEFVEAGLLLPLLDPFYNINFLVSDQQPVGQLMTALFGYNGNPSLSETLAYLLYLLGITLAWGMLTPRERRWQPFLANEKTGSP